MAVAVAGGADNIAAIHHEVRMRVRMECGLVILWHKRLAGRVEPYLLARFAVIEGDSPLAASPPLLGGLVHYDIFVVRGAEVVARSFDFSPNTTLYLTAHDCTDFGKQSKELLAYRRFYLENGFDSPGDLPDYLPALLELIAALPADRAAEVCRFAQPKLSRLRERLIEANLSYAFLLDLVLAAAERLEASA